MTRQTSWAVAISTYNRPDVLEFTLSQFDKYGGDIIIINDHSDVDYPNDERIITNDKRIGIAKVKNKSICLLREYDHIFLFDDDCFPINDKWWEPYLNLKDLTGKKVHHTVHAVNMGISKQNDEVVYWTGCLGCALMIDQEVLRVAGGMDNRFGFWGYEHAEYTYRICKMGITPHPFITPKVNNLWSFDAQGSYGGFTWKSKSSIPPKEKDRCMMENSVIFTQRKTMRYEPCGSE